MRKYWLEAMLKIARPVIKNLADGNLHNTIPKEFHKERENFIMLEAFGRTACGIAPWLELELSDGAEKDLQKEYRALIIRCIENATNPDSPDYMNWSNNGGQPLVDAAFLAHAVIRAPKSFFFSLSNETRQRFINCLKESRKIAPANCNWLFFPAIVEAALFVMDADCKLSPVDRALDSFENWYAGDGTYKDGEFFHWDYYNSYVIHPMQLDILRTFRGINKDYEELYAVALKRASRYAQVLEQLINADGTYAVFGRSSVYRFGAFQLLSQAALQEFLPESLTYGQVRCALSSVIHKVFENPDTFDKNEFLAPGIYGCQPELAEEYINVGSLYLCETVFLPLGLPENHKFWTEDDADWTAKKIWTGQNACRDRATD